MAANKSSFIVYTDWKQDFEFLTDAEAGKLIKHLLQFASDENPCLDKEDRLLQFAAQKMKSIMKKDLKKYEEVINKRIESGKLGGINSAKSRTYNKKEANEANASKKKQNERGNGNGNGNGNEEIINFHFLSDDFKNVWKKWKDYRKDEFKKNYKKISTEQAALEHLLKLSGQIENVATEIIEHSIANQYQGLFELKKFNQNGTKTAVRQPGQSVEFGRL